MADKKISELDPFVPGSLQPTLDLLPIYDSSTASTKKVAVGDLISGLLSNYSIKQDGVLQVSTNVIDFRDNFSITDFGGEARIVITGKQDTLVSGTNIKTINGESILGSGDIVISTSVSWGEILGLLSDQTDLQNAFDLKANLSGAAFTGAVSVSISGSSDTLQLINSGSGTTLNITNSGSGDFLAIDTNKLVVSNNGNLAVDTNTLFVDAVNDRVGIGTATPTTNFHFLETSSTNSFTVPIKFEITRTTGGNGNEITFFGSSTEAGFQIKTGTNFVDFFGNTSNFKIQGASTISIGSSLSVSNSLSVVNNISAKTISLTSGTTSSIPLTVTAAAGQTANLLEINSSSGSGGDLFRVRNDGLLFLGSGNTHYIGRSYNILAISAANNPISISGTNLFYVRPSGVTDKLRVEASGVQIGAAKSPDYDLDVSGSARITNNLIVSDSLTVDTNTLFVDATNNRVGVGTATPTSTLEVSGYAKILAPNSDNQLTIGRSVGFGGSVNLYSNSTYALFASVGANTQPFISFRSGNKFVINAINTNTPSAQLTIYSSSSSTIGQIIQAAAGQTANLQEWKDSAGNILASIGSAGKLSIGATGGLRYTPIATRYTDYSGLNLGGGIYLSFPSTGSDSFAFLVGGSATSNIYMYCNAAGNINTRGSILLGAADGAATLAGAVSSAQLEVRSTTKGFLPPRMTGAQVEAISTPAEGLIAYATNAGAGDVTAKGAYLYNGSNWELMSLQTELDTKADKLITANRQTESYTLVIGDADKLVEMNVGSANNLTVPLNSSVAFPTGTQISLAQYGAGQTTIVATSGVTIRSAGGALKLAAQYSGATLVKIDTDEWYLFGDITT